MSLFKSNKSIARLSCIGVRLKEYGIEQEDLDSCFELFEKTFSTKVYTIADINEISKRLGFDVNEYYVFIENEILRSNKEISIKILYRYFGSKNISDLEIEKIFSEKIDKNLFFTRGDIQKLSESIGASVWDRNIFNPYVTHEYEFKKSKGEIYKCILKPDSKT